MSTESSLGALLAGLGVVLIFAVIILLAILIPTIIAEWKLFKKAGKKGWEAIVPFYNTWILVEISGLNWWYFLISLGITLVSGNVQGIASTLLKIAGWYINFNIYYNIAKKTKQNEILYGILGTLIPFVAILILGFNKNITYNKETQVSPNGVF